MNIPTINLARTGTNIVMLRKAAGLTVHDLQMAFGFNSPQAIYKWQNGTALPTVDNLIALAALLHVRIDDILITDHSVAYPHSAAYASEHGEMAQYNRSYQANSACKEAIEQAISAHYAENRLDTEAAVKDVLEKFGTERVQFILANTIQRKNHDGRISQDNKAWAKTIPMPEDSDASRHCAYLVVDGVNPGLTDLFTRQARKAMQEQQKSSVLQKLRQEPPARKPAAPKKQEPER